MSIEITIAALRTSTDTPPSLLYITDLGQEGHWYYDGAGTLPEDNTGTILITADLKRFKRIYDDAVSVKWFGAKGDGITDDSLPVFNLLKAIDSGYVKKALFPTGTYKISTSAQSTISNKTNISILMDDDASFLNDDFLNDFIAISLTFSGSIATAISTVPHTYINGLQIVIKDSPDNNYNGVYIITVVNSTTFTYSLIKLPTGPSTGKTRRPDISRTLITFNNCTNCNIDFNFNATIQPISVQYRLGWVGVKFQNNCQNITGNLRGTGLSYLVWSGDFGSDTGNLNRSLLNVHGVNVGYPIALWKSGNNSTFNVFAENVHRGTYAAAVNNSTFNILAKNYDIAGILLTIHDLGGATLYGSDNNRIDITDFGSDIPVQLPTSGVSRNTVTIFGYDINGVVDISNTSIDLKSSNAKYTVSIFARTANAQHKISNLNIRALIDRRNLTPAEMAYECTIGDDTAGKSGTYSGINFPSWRVYNPVAGTIQPLVLKAITLTDDITFSDFYSTSPRVISLPAGKRVFFQTQKFGALGTPNGAFTSTVADLYVDSAGTVDNSLYLKYLGTNNQGWYTPQPIIFGSTVTRPAVTTRGFNFFDTSIGRPVWWNGSSWTDLLYEAVLSVNTSITLTDNSTYIFVDASSGDITVTLPNATTSRGKRYVIKKTDATTNKVTVLPVLSQKIDLCNDIILKNQDAVVHITSNAVFWGIININNTFYNPNTTDTISNTFLNTTYPATSWPIGSIISYYNKGKEYRRETATVWSEKVITLTP